jgi:hypothetical protein
MKNIAIGFFILSLFSCRKENRTDCFKGNGKETMQSRTVEAFKEIHVLDNFEVEVIQSAEQRIEVQCGEHVIDNIGTTVKDSILTISNNNHCNFVRGYKRVFTVRIFTPRIVYILNDGVGAILVNENFTQDSISVKINSSGDFRLRGSYRIIKTVTNGNGDMYVSGKTDQIFVFTNGTNYVNTKELIVKSYMLVHTLTLGDCYVNADGTRQLDCTFQGKGNIYYSGKPGNIYEVREPGAEGKLIQE